MKRYLQIIVTILLVTILLAGCKVKTPDQYYGEQDSSSNKTSSEHTSNEVTSNPNSQNITLSIRCDTILNNMDKLNASLKDVVPKDGVLLDTTTISIKEKEKGYDVLVRIAKENKLVVNFSGNGDSVYIIGINGIKEFSCGPLSGWKYRVNGVFPGVGFGTYELKQGDVVEILYTCDLGTDLQK